MTPRKKSHNGKILAAAILVLGLSLAWISRNYYQARHPSAEEAQFIDANQISARFAQRDLPAIVPGLPARISVGETGYSATVAKKDPKSEGDVLLMLTGPNSKSPPAGTACRVTVDASIPREALKPTPFDSKPPED